MTVFSPPAPTIGPVQAVVLDWAGTTVDYGCMGPAAVFVDVFAAFDIQVTVSDARQFMGLAKKDHIRRMCALPGVVAQWRQRHSRVPDESDVDRLYARTEPMMVETIVHHARPIDGLLPFVAAMHERGIKIGACTGYTAPMMAALSPKAAEYGYVPDVSVCASDVPQGRPHPWMCYQNAMALGVYPMAAMVKIGDTISDVEEGRNAGMWTVGLTQSGNELGLPQDLVDALAPQDLTARLAAIEARYRGCRGPLCGPGDLGMPGGGRRYQPPLSRR
ncbi:phosphonoacetaldehyde hydrolase [Desulfosarcina cetonica]|uniref:phosphonoacetaldehyde hydrolase n=1 Tax=Desulfosarcina cetonica TaxID=90730 RepID=UPI000B094E7A|nr:phosphonoacetaldehyde hydrolase [Desulfosarcina cetonica]